MSRTRQTRNLSALIKEEEPMTVDAPKQVRFSKDIKVEREIISTSKQVKFKTEDIIKEEPGRDLSTKIEVIDEETLG